MRKWHDGQASTSHDLATDALGQFLRPAFHLFVVTPSGASMVPLQGAGEGRHTASGPVHTLDRV